MRITVFGDIMCDVTYLKKCKNISKDEFLKSFKDIKNILTESDYVVGNLETPIAGAHNGYAREAYSFNAPVEFAEALKEIGFDMVLTANNHCLDRGKNGLIETIKNLKKCGLLHIGTHLIEEESYKIINISGVKVGFINFTYGTNAFHNKQYLKRHESYIVDLLQKQELHNKLTRKIFYSRNKFIRCMKRILNIFNIGSFYVNAYERRENDFPEKRRFIKTIEKCKNAGAKLIIVMPHVGGQYNNEPNKYTKMICDLAIKHGADAVLANHEHVIHNINKNYLKDKKLIAYSLGNFFGPSGVLKDPFDKKSEYSMAIHIDITEKTGIEYYFSLYKTIVTDESTVKVVNLYDLISECKNDDQRKQLTDDNDFLVNMILGNKLEKSKLKKYYKVIY